MKDAALRALYAAIDASRPGLLLADEQCIETPARNNSLQAISNRVDVCQRFADAGFSCALSDFALVDAAPTRIYYRLSKEKALVHYLINQALARLPVGGQLLLGGDKSDGFKTYYQKACALVGSAKSARKVAGGAYVGVIEKRVEPSARLDDSDYTALIDIAPDGHPRLFSKPGIYGWKKIDRGSALLIENLQAVLESHETPSSVLDLGCGYGYLSVMASRLLPGARVVATDNNVTALKACEANFAEHGIAGECIVADCAQGIDEPFDLVLCNPPFHKGFDIHGDLTKAFLNAAASRLKAGGSALFVVNQFIGLEQKAASSFARCRLLAAREGFTVFLLSV